MTPPLYGSPPQLNTAMMMAILAQQNAAAMNAGGGGAGERGPATTPTMTTPSQVLGYVGSPRPPVSVDACVSR